MVALWRLSPLETRHFDNEKYLIKQSFCGPHAKSGTARILLRQGCPFKVYSGSIRTPHPFHSTGNLWPFFSTSFVANCNSNRRLRIIAVVNHSMCIFIWPVLRGLGKRWMGGKAKVIDRYIFKLTSRKTLQKKRELASTFSWTRVQQWNSFISLFFYLFLCLIIYLFS